MITILALAVVWFAIGKSISASAVTTVFTSLTLMLYLLVPWTAANLVDFFFVRRGHYAITELFKVDGIYGRWGRRGLIAYGLGFVCRDPVHGPARTSPAGATPASWPRRSTASTSPGSSA